MSELIRSFIAVEIDNRLRQYLGAVEKDLQRCAPDVKWTRPEQIHLTLKFLGEIPAKKIHAIKEQLPLWIKKNTAFTLSLCGLGAFPAINRPRVIWVGVDSNAQEPLAVLAAATENGLAGLGIAKEKRPFTAHITLGRVRSDKNILTLAESLGGFRVDPGYAQTVTHLTLFKSTLSPHGAVHEILARAPLQSSSSHEI